jgi:hypothetical protein
MQPNPTPAVTAQQPPIPVRRSRCTTLSPEELEARRADPQREEDDGVACRICGIVMKRLNNHFLKDGLANDRAYHQHCQSQGWGSPPIAVSGQQSAQLERRIRASTSAVKSKILRCYDEVSSARKVAKLVHLDNNFVAAVITKAGRMRANGEARRGRSTSQSADKWRMVEARIIKRKSTREIAQESHLASPSNVTVAFQKMGLSGKRGYVCCSFGEVIDRPALQRLHKISELTVRELAQQLGTPRVTLRDLLNPTRLPGQDLAFGTALKIAKWWKSLFFRLMSEAPANPRAGDRPGQSSIVLKFFPDLGEKYLLLMQALQRLAEDQQKNLKLLSRHDLQQHLCEQARRETTEEKAGRSVENLFRRFLIWAPEIMDFLAEKEKFQDLRGVDHAPLARKIIAGWLRTTETSVTNVMYRSQRKQIREISAVEMRGLILNHNGADGAGQPQPPQSEASKEGNGGRGRQKGAILEKTKPKITLAAYYSSKGMKPYAMAPYVFPASNADEMENSRRAIRGLFKDHRSEIEAEKARLSALSEVELEAEIGSATQEVMREAERKRDKKRDNKRGKPLAA